MKEENRTLISDEYRRLNTELHERHGGYGTKGRVWAPRVIYYARKMGITSILDYGCGKGSLRTALDPILSIPIREYDPAIAGKDGPPEHADLVICTDVLEHVEPENIDSVIAHLVELADRAVLVAVACRPGKRVLENGKPDHLTVEPPKWWARRFAQFGKFKPIECLRKLEYCAMLVKP